MAVFHKFLEYSVPNISNIFLTNYTVPVQHYFFYGLYHCAEDQLVNKQSFPKQSACENFKLSDVLARQMTTSIGKSKPGFSVTAQ